MRLLLPFLFLFAGSLHAQTPPPPQGPVLPPVAAPGLQDMTIAGETFRLPTPEGYVRVPENDPGFKNDAEFSAQTHRLAAMFVPQETSAGAGQLSHHAHTMSVQVAMSAEKDITSLAQFRAEKQAFAETLKQAGTYAILDLQNRIEADGLGGMLGVDEFGRIGKVVDEPRLLAMMTLLSTRAVVSEKESKVTRFPGAVALVLARGRVISFHAKGNRAAPAKEEAERVQRVCLAWARQFLELNPSDEATLAKENAPLAVTASADPATQDSGRSRTIVIIALCAAGIVFLGWRLAKMARE